MGLLPYSVATLAGAVILVAVAVLAHTLVVKVIAGAGALLAAYWWFEAVIVNLRSTQKH